MPLYIETIYISGPMTGYDNYNYPAFQKAKEYLLALGYRVKSPHDAPQMPSYNEYMKYDIKLLMDCDSILMLDGWENSKGACLEKLIADFLGYQSYKLINGELYAL